MTDIKPRIDADGVPWCHLTCPHHTAPDDRIACVCDIDDELISRRLICPHAVKRMAVENEAWRSGRMLLIHVQGDKDYPKFHDMFAVGDMGGSPFDTIEAAVSALMAEGEGE